MDVEYQVEGGRGVAEGAGHQLVSTAEATESNHKNMHIYGYVTTVQSNLSLDLNSYGWSIKLIHMDHLLSYCAGFESYFTWSYLKPSSHQIQMQQKNFL